jgi:hypothetical protein
VSQWRLARLISGEDGRPARPRRQEARRTLHAAWITARGKKAAYYMSIEPWIIYKLNNSRKLLIYEELNATQRSKVHFTALQMFLFTNIFLPRLICQYN